MRLLSAILMTLLLASCNGGGSSPPPVPTSGWTPLYSSGIASCDNFDFGELHYCVKQQPAQIGQTISASFTISGTGSLYPVDPGDIPPPMLRLFVAHDPSGTSGTRWWCPSSKTDLSIGTFTVSCLISSEWTSVGGGLPDPGPPNGILFVGFTTGGQYFAGHGVAANGQVHFTLNSYTVGNLSRRKASRRSR